MARPRTTPEADPAFPLETLQEAAVHLKRPFTPLAVKMKPQATTGEGDAMKGLVTYYIDARLAAARLNTVVGYGAWEDEYDVLIRHPEAAKVGLPVQCTLSVMGVSRVDVGQIAPGSMDEKAWKSAYSDALKRAAVKFGVGAYLYGGTQVWAKVKVGRNGKAQGFAPEGIAQARKAYAAWIGLPEMVALWGEPLDHGDLEPHVDGEPAAEAEAPAVVMADEAAVDAMLVTAANVSEAVGAAASEAVGKVREKNGGSVPLAWVERQVTNLAAASGGES